MEPLLWKNVDACIVPIIQLVQSYKGIEKVSRRLEIQHTKSGPVVPQNGPMKTNVRANFLFSKNQKWPPKKNYFYPCEHTFSLGLMEEQRFTCINH